MFANVEMMVSISLRRFEFTPLFYCSNCAVSYVGSWELLAKANKKYTPSTLTAHSAVR